jgi:hypothetical protein
MTPVDAEAAAVLRLLGAVHELEKAIAEMDALGDGFVFHRRAASRLSSFMRELELETPVI